MKSINNYFSQHLAVFLVSTKKTGAENKKIEGLKLFTALLIMGVLPLFTISQNQTVDSREFRAPDAVELGNFAFQRLFDVPYHQFADKLMGANMMERTGVGGPVWAWSMNEYDLGHDMMGEIWWQTEFSTNMAFSYHVFNSNSDESIGQVSIFPSKTKGYDTEVYIWLHSGKQDEDLDKQLFEVVEQWLSSEWPFESVAYPGRKISWKKWAKR